MSSFSEELEHLFVALDANIGFASRPQAIPGDLRVRWRLSILCLMLEGARGKTLALPHLHVLWWATKSAETRQLFLRSIDGETRPGEVLVRFDPTLSTTVDLGLGCGLVTRTSAGGVKLTPLGASVASACTSAGILSAEQEFLTLIPHPITQALLNGVLNLR